MRDPVERDRALVQEFVLGYFTQVGAAIEEVSPGVYRVEVAREVAAELDGTPWFPWYGQDGGAAHVTYYFTFDPDTAQLHPDVEHVTIGSQRVEQLIHSVKRNARTASLWLPAFECVRRLKSPPRAVVYRPFFVFHLGLRAQGAGEPRQSFAVAVDRVDQLPLRQLATLLPRLPLRAGRPPAAAGPLEPARISLEVAFALAFEELLTQLEADDLSWAQQASRALADERARLIQFFAERAAEGDDVAEERERRLAELKARMPRVRVKVESVADVYLPVACEPGGGSARHLAFALA